MKLNVSALLLGLFLSLNLFGNECVDTARAFSGENPTWVYQYQKEEIKGLKRSKLLLKSLLGENSEIYAEKLTSESFQTFLKKAENQKMISQMAIPIITSCKRYVYLSLLIDSEYQVI